MGDNTKIVYEGDTVTIDRAWPARDGKVRLIRHPITYPVTELPALTEGLKQMLPYQVNETFMGQGTKFKFKKRYGKAKNTA